MSTTMMELENFELENGGMNSTNCPILLAHYLLAEDFLNAKFLWTRSTTTIKQENDEIDALWSLGKKLSAKEFREFFAAVKQRQWSEAVAPIIAELIIKTRRRVFRLVCLAYTKIRTVEFASMLDLPVDEAVKTALDANNAAEFRWNFDAASQMLEKIPPPGIGCSMVGVDKSASIDQSSASSSDSVSCMMEPTTSGVDSEYQQRQFQILTDYVSFLEN